MNNKIPTSNILMSATELRIMIKNEKERIKKNIISALERQKWDMDNETSSIEASIHLTENDTIDLAIQIVNKTR